MYFSDWRTRFWKLKGCSRSVVTLKEAIDVYEENLKLRPVGHEHRAQSLSALGDAIGNFCVYHGPDDARATYCIELLREALRLRPAGCALRDRSLHELARALGSLSFEQQPDRLDALTECVSLCREVLQLRPLWPSSALAVCQQPSVGPDEEC
jgi:hypothetical protein